MNSMNFFTSEEKVHLQKTYRKLLSLSGNALKKEDCVNLKTYLKNAAEQNYRTPKMG